MTTAKYTISIALLLSSTALAGARIDFRIPGETVISDPESQGVVLSPGDYTVEVYMVDTGNPQGNISFRGLYLDSADTESVTVSPTFTWTNPDQIGVVFPDFPNPAWIYPVPVLIPHVQITLPDNGEVLLGTLTMNVNWLNLGELGVLDLVNKDAQDPNLGARADFGFGVLPNDPVTTWRAHTGEITGGVLQVVVTPEPGSLLIMFIGASAAMRANRQRVRRVSGT